VLDKSWNEQDFTNHSLPLKDRYSSIKYKYWPDLVEIELAKAMKQAKEMGIWCSWSICSSDTFCRFMQPDTHIWAKWVKEAICHMKNKSTHSNSSIKLSLFPCLVSLSVWGVRHLQSDYQYTGISRYVSLSVLSGGVRHLQSGYQYPGFSDMFHIHFKSHLKSLKSIRHYKMDCLSESCDF
jgi:hypothetical protein